MMTGIVREALLVYPSLSGEGIITISTKLPGTKTVSLIDADGTRLQQIVFTSCSVDMQTTDLHPGTYYLQLEQTGEASGVKILVIS